MHLQADRAFDAEWLRKDLLDRDITPVIPPKSNGVFPAEFDKGNYNLQHLIENQIGKLRENGSIKIRPCKTEQIFKAFISIAATIINTK